MNDITKKSNQEKSPEVIVEKLKQEFCKRLEAEGIKLDRPYRAVPSFNTHTAHLTDPWGTNIELVDGMASIR